MEPRTSAGRALLKQTHGLMGIRDAILAIEAQARPAVASEGGVRAALTGYIAAEIDKDTSSSRWREGAQWVQEELLRFLDVLPATRPAVASEGLRAALDNRVEELVAFVGRMRDPDIVAPFEERGIRLLLNLVIDAAAAPASNADSVGALDVERLARALPQVMQRKSWSVGLREGTSWHTVAAAIAAAYDAGEGER